MEVLCSFFPRQSPVSPSDEALPAAYTFLSRVLWTPGPQDALLVTALPVCLPSPWMWLESQCMQEVSLCAELSGPKETPFPQIPKGRRAVYSFLSLRWTLPGVELALSLGRQPAHQ